MTLIFRSVKSYPNSLEISFLLPDKSREHNTNTHKILMIFIILIGQKVFATKSDLQGELYIQNGDAASRRVVRLFTHNFGNHPELLFSCKISSVTATAVLYSVQRRYRGPSH